ncbi:uncharacterized protein LOC144711825 [Wolffia australiana]
MSELLAGVFLGIFGLLAVQAIAILAVLARILRKKKRRPHAEPSVDRDGDGLLVHDYRKKGIVWVLDPEMIPSATDDASLKSSKEQRAKRKLPEVSPSRKYAKIIGHSLSLMDANSHQEEAIVQLTDCIVLAVSGSDKPSRKWAKRYPIKIEGKNSAIYNGSEVFYLYLENSWEKEAWCKALRQASCPDTEKRYAQLRKDFSDYIVPWQASESLSSVKSSDHFHDAAEKLSKVDSSSKVRQLFKKMARKASKNALTYESGWNKIDDKLLLARGSSLRGSALEKNFSSSSEISSQFSSSDLASSERYAHDDGRASWNFILSRIFFDAQRNSRVNNFIKERIQKSLSNMKTPTYIGGITCIGLDLGNLPPYFCNIRVLPVEEDNVWAIEVDIEYTGGFSLEIETRFEVGESDFQESDSEVASALLGDLEQNEEFLNLANQTDDAKPDGGLRSKSSGWASRYKSVLNYIADQVSQVPLSLSLRISSLRGTLKILVKPPPSDQLWLGFTSTPEIELTLGAAVGDCGLGGGHVISLLRSRLKTAIQETLVLPNCECVAIPGMLAEKDDWVPRAAAPYGWFGRRQAAPPPPSGDPPASDSPGGAATRPEISPESSPATAAEERPKLGWKARIKDQGKRMGGKLEEKRRLIVEKMLENVDKRA